MLKLPSIDTLVGSTIAAVKRFPMVMFCATLGAALLIYLTHYEWRFHEEAFYYTLSKMLMCCELGLPLFLAFALMSETGRHSNLQKLLWQVIALALVTGYFFTLGNLEEMNMVRIARYFLFLLTAHLLVSFAPFLSAGNLNGFWQYNKTLFLRFLLSGLYTVVLYGGISLALWSIDELLHIKIDYKIYLYTWYTLGCVFSTCFFLAGVPKNLEELEGDTSYLKGLKVFTQYVLLPLVTLYLLILYAYIGKILIEWRLPKGLVSYLVIGYSIAGIFSLLLIYPVRNNEENRWIHIFSRWFYLALFPLIIMLGVSIFSRIAEYGITENRYFILVLALWLFGIALYFVGGTRENIKVIPISLCFLAFFSSFGPWGAFSVSEHSQAKHLEKILTQNKILVNGKIDSKTQHSITSKESDEIYSVVEYLGNSDALDLIQPWFGKNIDTIKNGKISAMIDAMNYVSGNDKGWKTVYMSGKQMGEGELFCINVKGFDTYSSFYGDYYNRDDDTTGKPDTSAIGHFIIGADSFSVNPERGGAMYRLKENHKAIASFDLNGFLNKLNTQYDTVANESYSDVTIPADKFMLDVEADSMSFRFMFKTINMEKRGDKLHFREMQAAVLSKRK